MISASDEFCYQPRRQAFIAASSNDAHTDNKFVLPAGQGKVRAGKLPVTIGRAPKPRSLAMEATGITVDAFSAIPIDKGMHMCSIQLRCRRLH